MVIRPATAVTRRKEITVKMNVPREIFDDLMSELKEGDADGLVRDSDTGSLVPTKITASLKRFEYTIKSGYLNDRLFKLNLLNPSPRPRKAQKTAEVQEIGQANVYEVETIREKRIKGKKTEFLVKWEGYADSMNTWEPSFNIHPNLVAAFEGKPLLASPVSRVPSAPSLPHRGADCARARLSQAEERRGGVPEMMSMVAGNTVVQFKQRLDESLMPVLTLRFFVLTIDKTGHVTWPTKMDGPTMAMLRRQARAPHLTVSDSTRTCDRSELLSDTVGLLSDTVGPVGLSDCRTCRTVGLLSEVTVGLSDQGSETYESAGLSC